LKPLTPPPPALNLPGVMVKGCHTTVARLKHC
jgi:hypothetical protein